MGPLLIIALIAGGGLVISQVFSKKDAQPKAITTAAPVLKLESFVPPSVGVSIASLRVIGIPAIDSAATMDDLRKAFAAAAERGDAARKRQFETNRAYAKAQMEEWAGYLPLPWVGKAFAWFCYGTITVANSVAEFLGLYKNDWNSDENVARAQALVNETMSLSLLPPAFGEQYAGSEGYGDALQRDLDTLKSDAAFFNRWRAFATWVLDDKYNPVLLDAQLIISPNGKPYFPNDLWGMTVHKPSVAILGRLVATYRGKPADAGMVAAVKAFDAFTARDKWNDMAGVRLQRVFDAAFNA
jgi:hypothetical protein